MNNEIQRMSKTTTSAEKKPLQSETEEDAEWSELVRRGDHVGMRHVRAEELRRKRKLSKAECAFLKQFDSDRARILRDPQAVVEKGNQSVRRGLMLLQSVIHEKRNAGASVEDDAVVYDAMCCLSLLAAGLCKDFIRYAEEGCAWASHTVFRDGKTLASAFSRLAIAHPEHFRAAAERSLTMPSLRARNPDFTCDAEAIIESIHLAEKHHAGNLHDNRTRIGALCHQFVAEVVDLVEAARLEIRQRGNTRHRFSCLPDLKGNARAWWKLEIKQWVHREFDWIRKTPRRNPALWQELEKATDHGTDSAKRAAFEKYCFNKLEQIAGKPQAVT